MDDDTLASYIKRRGLDFDFVEAELEQLKREHIAIQDIADVFLTYLSKYTDKQIAAGWTLYRERRGVVDAARKRKR